MLARHLGAVEEPRRVALDPVRQHPRNLFAVPLQLAVEGLTPRLMDAFLVYPLSHHRPIAEVLAPVRKDIAPLYTDVYVGMARQEASLDGLRMTREALIMAIGRAQTDADRQFLLAVKRGDADWSRFSVPNAEALPAVRWKLENLARMEPPKRRRAFDDLARARYG